MEQQGIFNQINNDNDNDLKFLINNFRINDKRDDLNFQIRKDLLSIKIKNLELKYYLENVILKLKFISEERLNLLTKLLDCKNNLIDWVNNPVELIEYNNNNRNIKNRFMFLCSELINFIQKGFIDKKIYIENYNLDIYNNFIESIFKVFLVYGEEIHSNINIASQIVEFDNKNKERCYQLSEQSSSKK